MIAIFIISFLQYGKFQNFPMILLSALCTKLMILSPNPSVLSSTWENLEEVLLSHPVIHRFIFFPIEVFQSFQNPLKLWSLAILWSFEYCGHVKAFHSWILWNYSAFEPLNCWGSQRVNVCAKLNENEKERKKERKEEEWRKGRRMTDGAPWW